MVAIMILELLLLLHIRAKMKSISPAEVICIYIWVAQLVYMNGEDLGYIAGYPGKPSNEVMPWLGIGTFSYIFLLVYSTTIGLSGSRGKFIQEISNSFLRSLKLQPAVIACLTVAVIVPMLLMDSHSLIYNRRYLLIGSSESYAVLPGLNNVFEALIMLSLLFLSAIFALGLTFRSPLISQMALPGLILGNMYLLAKCSRISAIPLLTVALFLFFTGRGVAKSAALICGVFAFYFIACALAGRAEGQFGFAALPDIFVAGLNGSSSYSQIILNLFQGIFITADSLQISADFPVSYKILSYSPLPSFIDGFASVRDAAAIRLSKSVPMSGVAEIYHFGLPFVALSSALFWILIRFVSANPTRFGTSYLLLIAIFLQAFITATTYGIRGCFRTMIVATILGLVITGRHRNSSELAEQDALPLLNKEGESGYR